MIRTDHLNEALYGANREVKQDNTYQKYCSLVYTVYNTPHGMELMSKFKESVMSPIFHQDSHVMAMREGQRQVLIDLIKAYEEGSKA